MSSDPQSSEKIGFSLSEGAFALFPPLEQHDDAFPSLAQPMLATSPLKFGSSPLAVRGDSYAEDLSAAGGSPEARFAQLMVAAAQSHPPPPHKHGPIVIVSSYTQFSDLAHGPRGVEAQRGLLSYRLNISDGTLTLLSATPEGMIHNPAFTRRHPRLPVVYACTESVGKDGQVVAFALDGRSGALRQHCAPEGAGGTSTCYLTIHHASRRMLLVNYWNSTVVTLALLPDGKLGGTLAVYDPKEGKSPDAKAAGSASLSPTSHVNHSRNDDSAQAERQVDSHFHAIVLEPTTGIIAYVPDLGRDVVRQFYFDEVTGVVAPCGEIVSGIKTGRRGLGPRYLSFAQGLPTCYVVNELSSQVAVFEYHADVAASIAAARASAATAEAKEAAMAAAKPTLTLIQTVSTLPEAFPREMNTCGRVTIHPTGDFVVTSNRGHDSVAVHRVHRDSKPPGMLTLAGIFHTRGETPRHFQFDKSGQWLIVANQDSNTCAVFAFNSATGQVSYTGNTYSCPSPNFVCVWDGA
jgi:6-phosphogluconolactonase (cycloisomerase 2 family)